MLISSLILLLLSNALSSRRDKSILFSRIVHLGLFLLLLSNALSSRRDKSILYYITVHLGLILISSFILNSIYFKGYGKNIEKHIVFPIVNPFAVIFSKKEKTSKSLKINFRPENITLNSLSGSVTYIITLLPVSSIYMPAQWFNIVNISNSNFFT